MENKLQFIREKCIEANPSIKDSYTVTEIYGASGTNAIGEKLYRAKIKNGREIRLADVLWTIKSKDVKLDMDSRVESYLFITNKEGYTRIWNLKQDNLELQSEECIEFIYNLLK